MKTTRQYILQVTGDFLDDEQERLEKLFQVWRNVERDTIEKVTLDKVAEVTIDGIKER